MICSSLNVNLLEAMFITLVYRLSDMTHPSIGIQFFLEISYIEWNLVLSLDTGMRNGIILINKYTRSSFMIKYNYKIELNLMFLRAVQIICLLFPVSSFLPTFFSILNPSGWLKCPRVTQIVHTE